MDGKYKTEKLSQQYSLSAQNVMFSFFITVPVTITIIYTNELDIAKVTWM